MISCIIMFGFALVMLIYTIELEQREIKKKESKMRKSVQLYKFASIDMSATSSMDSDD